ncbi:very-long-chain (3R)-3-hydroxyacyl-CoA dehydratase-like [Chanos chanos]|uniref:Very-long-chain (3R)-3-hydroxyacyl-CoA dehydratase n=1 Tax=Chanos chanos TaxID=29144 RepID=A0A6J2ULP7_CHACN|nr:very-long-chain (3R)-3-hydroxyacyl-CoA dehydratase-like [Chanos chanos]
MGLSSLRRAYLFLYNLLQSLGFLWIFSYMTIQLILFGQDALYSAFSSCATVLYNCQILSVVEVINPMLGLIRTPVFPVMIQVVGRNFMLFVIFGSLPEIQNQAIVFFVFYLWSAMEIFRYPFYMLACVGIEWKALSWCRYTVWMLLYPLGTIAEAVAVLHSLPVFDETRLFSIPLPKTLGLSISFSFTLRLYLGLLLFGLFTHIWHLIRQRRRHLRTDRRKDS